jgi:hypothetical protein
MTLLLQNLGMNSVRTLLLPGRHLDSVFHLLCRKYLHALPLLCLEQHLIWQALSRALQGSLVPWCIGPWSGPPPWGPGTPWHTWACYQYRTCFPLFRMESSGHSHLLWLIEADMVSCWKALNPLTFSKWDIVKVISYHPPSNQLATSQSAPRGGDQPRSSVNSAGHTATIRPHSPVSHKADKPTRSKVLTHANQELLTIHCSGALRNHLLE